MYISSTRVWHYCLVSTETRSAATISLNISRSFQSHSPKERACLALRGIGKGVRVEKISKQDAMDSSTKYNRLGEAYVLTLRYVWRNDEQEDGVEKKGTLWPESRGPAECSNSQTRLSHHSRGGSANAHYSIGCRTLVWSSSLA